MSAFIKAFAILFILLSGLSLYRHRASEAQTFQSEIWADRAGYYVYLPAFFLYSMNTEYFPEHLDSLTGNGFELHNADGKVFTKYTCGVALMQAPFFATAHVASLLSKQPADGFSLFYRKSINLAAAAYLSLGLLLLFVFLNRIVPKNQPSIVLSIIVLFLGTNLYYYGIVATGMSHVYSFFLFAAYAWLSTCKPGIRNAVFIGITIGMIVLIRPTNLLFLPFPWLLHQNFQAWKYRFWPLIAISAALIVTPQLLYWKYLSGNWILYSYGEEGFSNALKPQFAWVLFSPHNGLLPYSLPLLFVPAAFFVFVRKFKAATFYAACTLAAIIYLSAAWHDPAFGCGAGLRNSTEYMVLVSIPFTLLISKLNSDKLKIRRIIFFTVLGICSAISFKVNYHYYGCYFGGIWNWQTYFATLIYPIPW
jgi:hypothetical protein